MKLHRKIANALGRFPNIKSLTKTTAEETTAPKKTRHKQSWRAKITNSILERTPAKDKFEPSKAEGSTPVEKKKRTPVSKTNLGDVYTASKRALARTYLTDLDEVSYLFNLRNFVIQPYSAKIQAKAIIMKDNAILFNGEKLKNLDEFLKNTKHKVYVDKNKINAYDYMLLGDRAYEMKINQIKQMKAQKNNAEIEHLKVAFKKTDNAVRAIRDYIYSNDNISEFDIAVQLAKEFKNQGALGLSFASIVAKDKNSALAHYSKCSKEEKITDGSLVLVDCGGYFEGGLATDITRVFVKGEPTAHHKKIYTNVLKAFLHAYNYPKTHLNRPINGYEIDKYVRDFFNERDLGGFIFNHGLGHGIGVNVHEYPPNLSANEIAKVPLLDGECFSIEPGLYKEGEFGVRLENSCYYHNGAIESFVKMNFEKKLINYDMLSDVERNWLEEFEVI